jgi:DNA mismatch endonuclease (patch repair protein)
LIELEEMARKLKSERRYDVLTAEQRSRCMSRIRGSNTGPEVLLRSAIWCLGHRYRLNRRMPGRPDLAFVASRVVVFVDGCFWHGCPTHYIRPKGNAAFWKRKLTANRNRDVAVTKELSLLGWRVLRFWEHEVVDDVTRVAGKISRVVLSRSTKR